MVGIARRSPTAALGVASIVFFGSLAVFAPWLMPYDPVHVFTGRQLVPPNAEHLFGTDGNGMDVFSRVIFASRFAFGVAIPAVLLSVLVGVPLGLWTGDRGGYPDEILMRIIDAIRVFPTIIIALVVVTATGQSLINVVIVFGVLDSPVFVRLVRAECCSYARAPSSRRRSRPATRGDGSFSFTSCSTPTRALLAEVPLRAAWAVRILATLAFFGIGIQTPTPDGAR